MNTKQSYPTIKDFVLQEAYEKSFETLVLGLKDFETEKSKILEEKKTILNNQFQKKTKEKMAARRIQKSALINHSRMQKMETRHKKLVKIMEQTEVYLCQNLIKNAVKYRELMKILIVEGLIRMLEPKVFVRCLKRDKEVVQGLISECRQIFQNLVRKQGIEEYVGKLELSIDEKYSLQERKIGKEGNSQRVPKSEENSKCFGGIILTNQDGLIVCKNTLDARIELAYNQMLPTIRRELF